MPSFSFVVIGEGNILLWTLRQLTAAQQHQVRAVFSDSEHVVKWCMEERLPVFARATPLTKVLKGARFDYLLSVNNPRVLKKGELRLAGRLNVNYHDSLLPAYAGVNASSWALINGETKHGVSLHVIEVGIDTGHVLEREEVPVMPEDSALALNLRCVEAYKRAFSRLLAKITTMQKLVPHVQDMSGRSYFGLHACPPNMGLLDFRRDFHALHDLARGLHFGRHENPLGSPKVLTAEGQYLLVTGAEPTQRMHDHGEVAPGTITDIADDTLVVKTGSDLILLSLAELHGGPIQAAKFTEYGLTRGQRLQSPCGPEADVMSCVRKKEAFWRRTLRVYEPTLLLRQKLNVASHVTDISDSADMKELVLDICPSDVPDDIEDVDFLLLSSFISFLARICCTNLVHVGLVADKSDIPDEYNGLYADICPGIFEMDLAATSRTAFMKCFEFIDKYKSSKTFLKDVQFRYPELGSGQQREVHHNLVIATPADFLHDGTAMERVLGACNMLLVLTLRDVKIFYKERLKHDFSHILDTLQHYPSYVVSLCSLAQDQVLLDVDLLTEEEKAVLYPPAPTPSPNHEGADLMTLLDKQCRHSPSAVAVKTMSHCLTYRELGQLLGDLAEGLKTSLPAGYRTEKMCVGLHLPNSMSYIISLLSCVKVHCPFLPLPLDLPTDRLAFTLRDAKVTTMITTEAVFRSDKFQCLPTAPVVLLKYRTPDHTLVLLQFEVDENDNVSNPQENGLSVVYSFDNLQALDSSEEAASLLEDCCYVMYTSGSTGRPKGVQVREPNIVNLALAQIAAWDLRPEDTTAQFASIGFDASISEIFTTLLSGGTLAVLREGERLGKEFVEVVRQLGVSVITLPPSVLNTYGPDHLPTLRKVVTAGEACMSHTAFKWTRDRPHVRFFNAYGPTETTVCATVYEFDPRDYSDQTNRELAIGSAVPGVCVYLLDDFLKPVPPEVVGEIYVGGAGVTGGYIGHASNRNAARFVPNPLAPQPRQRQAKVQLRARNGVNGMKHSLEMLDENAQLSSEHIPMNAGNNSNGFMMDGDTKPNELFDGDMDSKEPMNGNNTPSQLLNGNSKTNVFRNGNVETYETVNGNAKKELHLNGDTNMNGLSTDRKPQANGRKPRNALRGKASSGNGTEGEEPTLLYRTGDHAFQDSNGTLTFVGRLDDQVKIRGHRVDLSEIEQIILQHPKVEAASVVKHRCTSSSEPSIAAFVAPSSLFTSELQEYLSRALPKYMLPAFICTRELGDFPTSMNGKISRRALETDESVHEAASLNAGGSHLNGPQLTMARLWCHVLGMDESSAYGFHRLSSFSQLGGNSLHLVFLQRVIEDTFHVHLSFLDIGTADTLEKFTDIIRRKKDLLRLEEGGDGEEADSRHQLRKAIMEDSTFDLDSLLLENDDSQMMSEKDVFSKNTIQGSQGNKCCVHSLTANDIDISSNKDVQIHQDKDGDIIPNNDAQTLTENNVDNLENDITSELTVSGRGAGPMRILMSGVTGFLGAFLLHELLERSDCHVACMVRERSESRGLDRMRSNLERYGLWSPAYLPRLTVVLSDVSERLLGIAPSLYRSLCLDVDVVVINAAKMNFNTSYDDHNRANVLGTKEFLRFAFRGKKKFVFLTSSLSVFLFPPKDGGTGSRSEHHPVVTESDPLPDPSSVEGGYGQSKWASERLVLQALPHLPGGAVFRPARVSGRSMDGAGPRDDLFASCLLGMRQMGAVPDLDFPFDLTPVDFCARAMAEITLQCLQDKGLVARAASTDDDAAPYFASTLRDSDPNVASLYQAGPDSNFRTPDTAPAPRTDPKCVTAYQSRPDCGSPPRNGDQGSGLSCPDFVTVQKDTSPPLATGRPTLNPNPTSSPFPRVFHLFNPSTLPFKELFKDSGLPVLPLEVWRERLRRLDGQSLLLPLTPFFLSPFWDRAPGWPVFDTCNTDTLVSPATRRLMKPSRELLKVYERFFHITK